eukprot:1357095-Amorphochlora_amoeboformis.AAC.1
MAIAYALTRKNQTLKQFTSPGSYLQAPSNGSGPARTHGSLAKGKGALKMVKEKHRRFSGVGSIYYRVMQHRCAC